MSERVGERLEPSLEREGAGGRLKSLLTKKGLGLMEDLMKEGWMVGGKTYEEGVGVDGGSQGFALRRKVLASRW